VIDENVAGFGTTFQLEGVPINETSARNLAMIIGTRADPLQPPQC
jgi:hypothetical protein